MEGNRGIYHMEGIRFRVKGLMLNAEPPLIHKVGDSNTLLPSQKNPQRLCLLSNKSRARTSLYKFRRQKSRGDNENIDRPKNPHFRFLSYTILYYTILYYTILYCTIL